MKRNDVDGVRSMRRFVQARFDTLRREMNLPDDEPSLESYVDQARLIAMFASQRSPETAQRIAARITYHRAELLHHTKRMAQRGITSIDADDIQADHARIHLAMMRLFEEMQGLRYVRTINPLREGVAGTVETHARRRSADPITQLHEQKRITSDQFAAALDIAWVYEAVTRETMTGSPSYFQSAGGAPKGSGRRAPDIGFNVALEHANVYKPWAMIYSRSTPRRPAVLQALISVIVEGQSVYAGARQARMSWMGFLKLLREALDEYNRKAGWVGPHTPPPQSSAQVLDDSQAE